MRSIAALALAFACTRPTRAIDRPVQPTKPTSDPAGGRPVGPASTPHTSRVAIAAPHTGTIHALTSTLDGGAILSVDELGGVRLWPTLDGRQEPRVVELPQSKRLSLTRHGAGFSAVALDESGGLYVATLDGEGRTLSHTTYGIDPGFLGITAAGQGTIAWRIDHHVLLIDGGGALVDQLAAEPQTRILEIATAGNRVIALLDREGTRQARWLQTDKRLAWGAWLPLAAATELGSTIVLAPDHKHFATIETEERTQRVAIFEVATGKEVSKRQLPGISGEAQFADAKTLAFTTSNGVSWLPVEGETSTPSVAPTFMPQVRRQQLAAGGGRVIRGHSGELAILTPTEVKYLGYDTVAPRSAAAGGEGQLLLNAGQAFRVLDSKLDAIASPKPIIKPGTIVSDLVWLGGNDWLIESGASNGNAEIQLVDVATGIASVVRNQLKNIHVLAYEPSTDLATLSFGSASEVARLARKGRTLDTVVSAASKSGYELTMFVPLAPKLARGLQLVQISLRDKTTIKWIPDARSIDKASASLVVDGAYAAADSAGHVYLWQTGTGASELAVYTDGKQTSTVPANGPSVLWPDREGARVLVVSTNTIALYRVDGKQIWTRDISGVQDGVWLTDGGLALTHASGIARVDPATGTTTAARCGWDFGLSSKPHPAGPRSEPICMQLLQ
jgi:WD40 repeat protein